MQKRTSFFILLFLSSLILISLFPGCLPVTPTVTVNAELLAIGDYYGGGKVAYIDGSGIHGLIAATADQSTGIAWSNITFTKIGATAQGILIGTGQTNTTAIVGQSGCVSGAAWLCNNLNEGGYTDWFLPSKDELSKLYLNKVAIGGFADKFYWSSSELNALTAWGQSFNSGGGYGSKSSTFRVRAVRAF